MECICHAIQCNILMSPEKTTTKSCASTHDPDTIKRSNNTKLTMKKSNVIISEQFYKKLILKPTFYHVHIVQYLIG